MIDQIEMFSLVCYSSNELTLNVVWFLMCSFKLSMTFVSNNGSLHRVSILFSCWIVLKVFSVLQRTKSNFNFRMNGKIDLVTTVMNNFAIL